jgi:predicted nucleotidyltransferase
MSFGTGHHWYWTGQSPLAMAMVLMVFALRQGLTDAEWQRLARYVKRAFWGLNLALALIGIARENCMALNAKSGGSSLCYTGTYGRLRRLAAGRCWHMRRCIMVALCMDTFAADKDAIIGLLREFFVRHHAGIVCVYLYGSLARGEAHRQSDIDIAVLYTKDPAPTLDGLGLDLGDTLERRLGWPVDLLILNRAPVDLVHRVLRDGVLVYDHDPSSRISFEMRARSAYFDLLPYLRQYRRGTRDT